MRSLRSILAVSLFLAATLQAVVIPTTGPKTTEFTRTLLDDPNAAAVRTTTGAQKRVWIDVTEAPYNADNTGELDSTAAIQAAIDAVPEYGGTVVLPPGDYELMDDLTIPSDVHLCFSSGATISVADTKTLSFSSFDQIIAGPSQQIFVLNGTGNVTASGTSVGPVYPGWWGATNYAQFTKVVGTTSLGVTNSGTRSFTMATRSGVTNFPASYVRGNYPNTVMAFDVMPKGSPAEYGDNGYAWLDICDTDCASGDPAVATARVGARDGYAEFGSRSFNGADVLDVIITRDGETMIWLVDGAIQPYTNGDIDIGSDGHAYKSYTLADQANDNAIRLESYGGFVAPRDITGNVNANLGAERVMVGSELHVGGHRHDPDAWWKLDETSGTTVADSSGNGYNMTSQADTSGMTTTGVVGTALTFNGLTDYARIGASTLTGASGTITLWVNPTSTAAVHRFFASASEATNLYYIQLWMNAGGALGYAQRNNDTYDALYGDDTMTAGEWAFVACTSDGSTIALYLNGSLQSLTVANGANNGDWFDDTTNRENVTIGTTLGTGLEDPWYGEIDDVRVYSETLTAANILQMYVVREETPSEATAHINGVSYALPIADGTNGQSLQTNGSAVLSWGDTGSGGSWSDAVDSDIVPDTDDTYDLGDPTHQFTDGWFAGTLYADALSISEGGMADATIVDADIKDDTIQEPALNATNAPTDNYVLSYNAAGTNFTWVEAAGTGDLKADGTVPLTANWDVGAYHITALRFISDVATGTAPLTVSSTTVCTNLNADLLDGESAGAFQDYDADLTTYAGITPSASVQTFLGYADFDAMQTGLAIDDLIALSGVTEGATHLGTFTGTTITDSSTVKTALQELETAVESAGGHDAVTLNASVTDVLALSTQELGAVDHGADAVLIWDDGDSKSTYLSIAANIKSILSAADYAAMRTLLNLEAGTDFYSMSAADTAFEGELNDSAGLAAALDDETGTGVSVFATSPSLTTPAIAGATLTGTQDAGGADDFELPNGTDPVTDTAGQVAVDTDDEAIEMYGSESRLIPTLYLISKTIYDPDGIQGTIDAPGIFPVEAESFPHGITIKDCGIKTWSSTSYSVNFEEWTSPSDGSPSTIETVATSTSYEAEDDGTLTDASIAAGSIICVDLPDTDIDMLMVWFTYTVNPGD